MMPRRAIHLRWNYVEDHLWLFGGLLLAFGGALGATIAILEDPLRGMLAGALPIIFAVCVWAITNRASYRLRHPDSFPGERMPISRDPPAITAGDPFADPQPLPASAGHASESSTGKKRLARFRKKKSDAA